jgi:membrane protease YdiL (CAAX protease family)
MIITLLFIIIIILYPIHTYLGYIFDSNLAFLITKTILFSILPIFFIIYIEKWKFKTILNKLGIKRKKIRKSILLSLIVLIFTLFLGLIILWGNKGYDSIFWNIIMFFDAFNEELLFRGVIILYVGRITNIKVGFSTSLVAFILAHPQYINQLFLISTIIQGFLLGYVTYKTKNIIGPWISHGLNRTIIQLIRIILF